MKKNELEGTKLSATEMESINGGSSAEKLAPNSDLKEAVAVSAGACGSAAQVAKIHAKARQIVAKEGISNPKNSAARAAATPGCKRCW